jgi:hypothetical protein
MITVQQAKARLDLLIQKARVDLYKPIQIAEVLHRHRVNQDIEPLNLETFRNPSTHWRNLVTVELLGKKSTSSARYQHDVWNETAMPPEMLAILAQENVNTGGAVEYYIYDCYKNRQSSVGNLLSIVQDATPDTFSLKALLELFEAEPGMRRSIDKAYEIVTYALLETVVVQLEAQVTVSVPESNFTLLKEFEELALLVLGVTLDNPTFSQAAHVFRVGVTNAADRGLDMWANFGPAVQVKHLTVNPALAKSIVDQVESDAVVIVCVDAEAEVIRIITQQIGWGRRVRGVITQSQLVAWYDKALTGDLAEKLAVPLLETLLNGFLAEFPQLSSIEDFLKRRGYDQIAQTATAPWKV